MLQHRITLGTTWSPIASLAFVQRVALLAAAWTLMTGAAWAQATQTLSIRGHQQTLHLYGPPEGDPIVVSSGDGGWIRLGPHVAEVLAASGYFVVGFDVKAYLSGFTSGRTALRVEDEPGDYRVLAEFAARRSGKRPILIGISEGAGLSVLAATDPQTRTAISGVIGLGLGDLNELGWRWKDAIIYVTKGIPKEPTFSVAAIVDQVSPLPLAAIHATQDEYVPLAEIQSIFQRAQEPKQLWIVKASDHRFSDNRAEFDRRLFEASAWVREHAPR
jgi:alpha-beta hydrolase superfamily lysophospholipase